MAPSTTSTSTTSSSTTSSSTTLTSSHSGTDVATTKSTDTPVIVGGVVGGVVALAIIGGLIKFLVIRKKSSKGLSASEPPLMQGVTQVQSTSPIQTFPFPPPMFYDPNYPTTQSAYHGIPEP
jgi:beta-lactamase regulating signal transducer with metallopeptidase domain